MNKKIPPPETKPPMRVGSLEHLQSLAGRLAALETQRTANEQQAAELIKTVKAAGWHFEIVRDSDNLITDIFARPLQ
jgi:hypothetical protein